jgi:hypothetical protein
MFSVSVCPREGPDPVVFDHLTVVGGKSGIFAELIEFVICQIPRLAPLELDKEFGEGQSRCGSAEKKDVVLASCRETRNRRRPNLRKIN